MRAVIYTRVSEDRRQGRSVAQQEAECRAECDEQGWDVVDVLADNDVGASPFSTGRRPGWAKVLELVAAGGVDVLTTWEGSRAQRDLRVYVELRELCVATGVLWRYGGRTYDLSKWRDRRDTGRDAVDDEATSGQTSERIRRDMRSAAAAGRPHGRRLFGYTRRYDPSSGDLLDQVPCPDEAAVVARIFAERVRGAGVGTIVAGLNADGVASSGARWDHRRVRKVLVNPAYAGRRVHRGEVLGPAAWEPLVPPAVFDRVAAQNAARSSPVAARPRLLTSVLRCSVCGGHVAAKRANGKRVYQCRAAGHTSREERRLDDWVTAALLDRVRAVMADADPAAVGEPAEVTAARAKVAGLRAELGEALGLWKARRLSVAAYAAMEAELTPQIAAAERAARAAFVPVDLDLPDDLDRLPAWWDAKSHEQRREIVRGVVEVVVIEPVGSKLGGRYAVGDVTTIEWRRPR